uniref:Uncharacterized protein n=1 Tax=Solanum lycopersicum TaxID=4081 RepID=A0A3Q7HE57_SOLLC
MEYKEGVACAGTTSLCTTVVGLGWNKGATSEDSSSLGNTCHAMKYDKVFGAIGQFVSLKNHQFVSLMNHHEPNERFDYIVPAMHSTLCDNHQNQLVNELPRELIRTLLKMAPPTDEELKLR